MTGTAELRNSRDFPVASELEGDLLLPCSNVNGAPAAIPVNLLMPGTATGGDSRFSEAAGVTTVPDSLPSARSLSVFGLPAHGMADLELKNLSRNGPTYCHLEDTGGNLIRAFVATNYTTSATSSSASMVRIQWRILGKLAFITWSCRRSGSTSWNQHRSTTLKAVSGEFLPRLHFTANKKVFFTTQYTPRFFGRPKV